MPAKLQVEKFLPQAGEYWVNTYNILAAWDSPAAFVAANAVVAAEQSLHLTNVIITKFRISDDILQTNNFRTTVVNQAGTRQIQGDLMPLFVTARLDLSTGSGYPNRKYYRGVLLESETSFTTFTNAFIVTFGVFGGALLGIPELCTLNNVPFTQSRPALSPAMRQLRKGSKKRPIPL